MPANPPTRLTPEGVVLLVNSLRLVRRLSLWKRMALVALICLSVWLMASAVAWPWTKLHINKLNQQIAYYGDLNRMVRGK